MRSALKASSLAMVMALAFAPAALAQNVKTGGAEGLTIRGFLSGTMYAQDNIAALTGNGQNFLVAGTGASSGTGARDPWFLGGDVRNTRLTLAFNGPKPNETMQVGGVLEIDFFGGFFTPAGFATDEQPLPRLRLAYADLIMGGTTLRIGQAWSPFFGNVPVSLSHIAFPLGLGTAGMPGWRHPGLFLYQKLTPADAEMQMLLTVALMRGSWGGLATDDAAAASARILAGLSPGETSFIPQVEARLDISSKTFGLYVAGHFDMKDLSGRGAILAVDDQLPGLGAEVGARLTSGPLLIHGNVYYGQGMAQQIAHIFQFGNIQSLGAWAQVGFNATKEFGIFVYGGFERNLNDDNDRLVAPGSRNQHILGAAMLQYKVGAWAAGLEFIHSRNSARAAAPDPAAPTVGGAYTEFTGNQIALSGKYDF